MHYYNIFNIFPLINNLCSFWCSFRVNVAVNQTLVNVLFNRFKLSASSSATISCSSAAARSFKSANSGWEATLLTPTTNLAGGALAMLLTSAAIFNEISRSERIISKSPAADFRRCALPHVLWSEVGKTCRRPSNSYMMCAAVARSGRGCCAGTRTHCVVHQIAVFFACCRCVWILEYRVYSRVNAAH